MAPASHTDRRSWIVTAAAVLVLVAGFVLHAVLTPPKSVEMQIGRQVFSDGCFVTVTPNEFAAFRWSGTSKGEIIVCESSENDSFPNDIMDYAQFDSAAALAAGLKAAPPGSGYCMIGLTVITKETSFEQFRDAFKAMCAKRGGTFHEGVAA